MHKKRKQYSDWCISPAFVCRALIFVFRNEINEFYRLIYIIEDKWMEHTVATDPKEIKYIKKRCRKAFREKMCFNICRVFPIYYSSDSIRTPVINYN